MSLERELQKRGNGKCELCNCEEHLQLYTLAPAKKKSLNSTLTACKTCVDQIENPDTTDSNHWRCLNDSMWSEHQAVVLIKDLKVKGSSMIAKQGTAVRRISLDHENEKYIEGKVGPTQIVIITDYVKKI